MIKKSSNFAAGKKKKLFRERRIFTSLLKRKYNENLFYNVLFPLQRKGYTKKTCLGILESSPASRKQQMFNMLFRYYLALNMDKRSSSKETLMCTSDIIETIFGRYKNKLNQNPTNGITDMALIILAMTSKLNEEEIMIAMDCHTLKQIKQWRKDNLCDSLSIKRNKFYNRRMVG